ncbi:uncharacterized protein LOC123529539 [Mercenaria mercenaria]|uniref:uncharacterized protein LOC123529539 n=1 Tax=Mercenaria mercenaria TaxID=6596 RepID=UPI00234F0B7E|nr:uncharacterized protein LOC123529539 [Mercenaria mercenaria]
MQAGPQGGNGAQRPRPPPRGRNRRQTVHSFQKRQADGDQTCRQVANQNWMQDTCYVRCENANRDLDNCPSRSETTTTVTPRPTAAVTSQQTTDISKETSITTSSPTVVYALTTQEIRTLQESDLTVILNENNKTITLRHSGVPDHEFEGGWGQNPNTPEEQYYSFNIPMLATVAEEKGCVRLGSIGMSLSGAPFFNPYTNTGYNAVQGDCRETFDDCSGHPAGNGAYHYHKLPACLYKGTNLRDKLLGVALDGYPIYGPMDMSGKNWTSRELDKCHGHVDPYDNRYKYRITMDFPYILGCYHGEVIPRGPGRGRRDIDNDLKVYRYKRQLPSAQQCNLEEQIHWNRETCYAFCETPSKSLDNCEPASEVRSDTTTERDVNTLKTTTESDISGSSVHIGSFSAILTTIFICRSIYRRIS